MTRLFGAVVLLIGSLFMLAACAGSPSAAQTEPSPALAPATAEQDDNPPDAEVDITVGDESEEQPESKSDPDSESESKDSTEDAPSATAIPPSPASVKSLPEAPLEAKEYSWKDGDRTFTVVLQPDLALLDIGGGEPPKDALANTGKGAIVQSTGGKSALPVFKSPSGELMTLPGGVLLVLEPKLTASEVNSFFAQNGIKRDKVSELSYVTNGFFIETDPGFPSLDLANKLAALDDVIISSPNWWTEISTK